VIHVVKPNARYNLIIQMDMRLYFKIGQSDSPILMKTPPLYICTDNKCNDCNELVCGEL
jgi:hypothetical protein